MCILGWLCKLKACQHTCRLTLGGLIPHAYGAVLKYACKLALAVPRSDLLQPLCWAALMPELRFSQSYEFSRPFRAKHGAGVCVAPSVPYAWLALPAWHQQSATAVSGGRLLSSKDQNIPNAIIVSFRRSCCKSIGVRGGLCWCRPSARVHHR